MIKKNIPNLFTLGNLFCGCMAIVQAFNNDLTSAAYLIGTSCLFDFLDGLLARLLKVSSEIGKQLDSLADMVSFGVVPGAILFKMMEATCTAPDTCTLSYLPYIGFLVPLFSAVRLAIFNLDTRQTNSFIGLPTPANAIFISSLLFVSNIEWLRTIVQSLDFLICLSILCSLLLVAPLPLFALKFKTTSWVDNKIRYVFLLLATLLLVFFQLASIPLIIILYVLLSVLNTASKKNKTVH